MNAPIWFNTTGRVRMHVKVGKHIKWSFDWPATLEGTSVSIVFEEEGTEGDYIERLLHPQADSEAAT